MGIGPLELGIVAAILLLVLGPRRLPGLGRQLGGGLRELRRSVGGRFGDDGAEAPALPAAESTRAGATERPAAAPVEPPRA